MEDKHGETVALGLDFQNSEMERRYRKPSQVLGNFYSIH